MRFFVLFTAEEIPSEHRVLSPLPLTLEDVHKCQQRTIAAISSDI